MPTPTISELVPAAMKQLAEAIAGARKAGIDCQMPHSLDFTMGDDALRVSFSIPIDPQPDDMDESDCLSGGCS